MKRWFIDEYGLPRDRIFGLILILYGMGFVAIEHGIGKLTIHRIRDCLFGG